MPDRKTAEGEALAGGMVNVGAVFRRGELVERPAPPSAGALHPYLLALRKHGFDAAPVPVGLTADGREQMTFIPGDVALPPFPDWALTEAALQSVGRLLRRLHEAGAAVAVDTRAEWPRDLADPAGGTMLCHNDVCQENEVCRAFVTRRVAEGDPVYLQALTERGGWERWDRLRIWLADNRETFTAALLN